MLSIDFCLKNRWNNLVFSAPRPIMDKLIKKNLGRFRPRVSANKGVFVKHFHPPVVLRNLIYWENLEFIDLAQLLDRW